MQGVRCRLELGLKQSKQVVFTQNAAHMLVIDSPALTLEFSSDARTAIGRMFQRDPLDGIAQST